MDEPGTSPNETPHIEVLPATMPHDSDRADIEQNKDLAAFSYLWVMSIVVYFLRRKSPFVRFHAKQAMVLFVLSLFVVLVPIINRVLELGVLCLMVYGFTNAAQGLRRDVPIVGPLSRGEISIRQAWKQIVDFVAHVGHSFRSGKNGTPPASPPPAPPPSPPQP